MTEDRIFDRASVGKTFSASLCARLAAEGLFDPDTPFADCLPEHVLAKENGRITVRDLATHTGGFDNAKPCIVPDPKAFDRAPYAKRPMQTFPKTYGDRPQGTYGDRPQGWGLSTNFTNGHELGGEPPGDRPHAH